MDVRYRWWLLVAVLTMAVRAPAIRDRFYSNDEATYSALAAKLLTGGTMYVEAVDHKPPGIAWLYTGISGISAPYRIKYIRVFFVVLIALTGVLVGEHERRHRISDRRSRSARAVELKPRDKPVDRLGKKWACDANGVRESFKTHAERGVQVTRVLEGLFKNLGKRQLLHAISERTAYMHVQWYRSLHALVNLNSQRALTRPQSRIKGSATHCAVQPPSIGNNAPVIEAPASVQRKTEKTPICSVVMNFLVG